VSEDGLVFHFASRDLTFSNRDPGRDEFRGANLKAAAEHLDFQSIEDLIHRGDPALREYGRSRIKTNIEEAIEGFDRANEEIIRLFYRALELDQGFKINGKSFAQFAQQYKMGVEPMLNDWRKLKNRSETAFSGEMVDRKANLYTGDEEIYLSFLKKDGFYTLPERLVPGDNGLYTLGSWTYTVQPTRIYRIVETKLEGPLGNSTVWQAVDANGAKVDQYFQFNGTEMRPLDKAGPWQPYDNISVKGGGQQQLNGSSYEQIDPVLLNQIETNGQTNSLELDGGYVETFFPEYVYEGEAFTVIPKTAEKMAKNLMDGWNKDHGNVQSGRLARITTTGDRLVLRRPVIPPTEPGQKLPPQGGGNMGTGSPQPGPDVGGKSWNGIGANKELLMQDMEKLDTPYFRAASDSPDYRHIQQNLGVNFSFTHKDHIYMGQGKFIDVHRSGLRQQIDVGDKIHISVKREDVPKAFDVLKGLLLSKDNPFREWKVINLAKVEEANMESRLVANGQFTLYARTDDASGIYSAEQLNRMRTFIEELEKALADNNIAAAKAPDSDVQPTQWHYASYRNEKRSAREPEVVEAQQAKLKAEPFYQLLTEPLAALGTS